MNQNNHYDVIILGAGAAGLMCALIAGQGGKRVLVLEKSNKPGKKILMSGGGRCNFTNLNTSHDNFLSANPHFCKSALSRFTPWHFLDLVNKHHIPYHEKELGQLFCDHSSKDILNMLLDECAEGGVEIKLNVTVADVDVQQQVTITADGDQYISNALVMATGGLSIPKMGGSGFGYELAEQLGLNVLPRRAGLVPFVFTDQHKKLLASLSGVSIPVAVTVKESSNKQSFKHQMLFTHRGLSGPVMLQISSYWQQGNHLQIDLLPDSDGFDLLNQAKQQTPQTTLQVWFSQFISKKAAQALAQFMWPKWFNLPLQNLSTDQLDTISHDLHQWTLKPSATEGYRTAEVTLGGVDTHQLSSKTMASIHHPNVYFIGEVVDVTGHLGGFNFQWAWASAYAAADSILSI
ncbi:MAG: NAD(P)/FAD-dependent oxidoreductase [Marinicella sp.]